VEVETEVEAVEIHRVEGAEGANAVGDEEVPEGVDLVGMQIVEVAAGAVEGAGALVAAEGLEQGEGAGSLAGKRFVGGLAVVKKVAVVGVAAVVMIDQPARPSPCF
jgi:hypothetical protein